MRRFAIGAENGNAETNELIYCQADDLFLTLETGGDGAGPVSVLALRLKK